MQFSLPSTTLALFGLVASGCGGNVAVTGGTSTSTTTTPTSTGTGGHGTGGGGVGGGAVNGCPEVEPAPGSACSTPTLRCTYGDSAFPECRNVWYCEGAKWAPSTAPCNPAPACSKAMAPGVDCTGSEGARCLLGSGAFCLCSQCPSGPCMAPPPLWSCGSVPAAPCPATVPNDGSSCSTAGAHCEYGFPCGGSGAWMDCTGGAWKWESIACPN